MSDDLSSYIDRRGQVLSLAGVHGMWHGGTIAVLGRGPSLPDTKPEADCIIACHSALEVWACTWWLCLDSEPLRRQMDLRPPPNALIRAGLSQSGPVAESLTVYADHRDTGFPAGEVRPGMETLAWCQRGTAPGQAKTKRGPGPNVLAMCRSSVITGLHFALILGAAEIRLYGVELGGSLSGFDDPVPIDEGRQKELDAVRDLLDRFHDTWKDRVRLRNLSLGYEGVWDG